MSDDLAIPARIDGSGAIRFGQSYITIRQHLRVEGETLIVYEEREYDDRTRNVIEIGRFQLHPV